MNVICTSIENLFIYLLQKRMSTNWTKLLEDSETQANVKLVCDGGIVLSHKIVVASASHFIKNLLKDIPVGDEITIYLPGQSKDAVEKTLENIFLKLSKEKNVFDFDCTSQDSPSEQLKYEVHNHNIHPYTDNIKKEELIEDESIDFDEEVKNEPEPETELVQSINIKSKKSKPKVSSTPDKKTKEFLEDIEFDEDNAEYRIKEYEKQLVNNPSTPYEIKSNKRTKEQIRYERARLEVLR